MTFNIIVFTDMNTQRIQLRHTWVGPPFYDGDIGHSLHLVHFANRAYAEFGVKMALGGGGGGGGLSPGRGCDSHSSSVASPF